MDNCVDSMLVNFPDGKQHKKGTSFSGLAFNPDAAAGYPHKFGDYGKANTGSLVNHAPWHLVLKETFEDPIQVFLRYADATIGHPDFDPLAFTLVLWFNFHRYLAILGCKLECI